ncbi:MAG: hypothetical protein B6U88_00680 [Candidatus Aenigmarchaeota archaeon ex4484_56]|nr:MAG: hypothetical protein B6U88_00680 [Candidatus Aenigmarchaeota archaeon ex4484_56]
MVSLTINTVIILAISLMVMVAVLSMFFPNLFSMKSVQYQSAFDRGCKIYAEGTDAPENIILEDVTGDGEPDSLLAVCRLQFANPDMTSGECAARCQDMYPTSRR